MDRIVVTGGVPLRGTIEISGAKNAALPLLATALLTDEPVSLESVPDLADTASMLRLLQVLGVEARHLAGAPGRVTLHCPEVMSTTAPYDLVRKMRASVLVLGPLVARCGKASVSLPGGCAIGTRPIDLHLAGLEALGAEIELDGGYVHAKAPKGLRGGTVQFRQPSVGATENILMAASLARGESVIVNAAREPEIVDLAECLKALGAVIEGAGSSEIRVQGQPRLQAGTHRIMADRIEAGTYAMAAAITGGEIELRNATVDMLGQARETLEEAGVSLRPVEGGFVAGRANGILSGTDVMTRPFPGFATDLQAQFMAMMCVADGASMITETIFENRFMHAPELSRMGARITVHGGSALVRGVSYLKGAPVMATDLRASVSLVLAALAAEGKTEINRIYHLDRGYERLEAKLSGVGAGIERVS
ncbi:MAG TPA: UDP-N-acetylglucosamine 1-carboxyvinyltransferase [Geminicoccaceae bacterium]|nr:UDP-N-acetylglucosamine 1-carboxyvinyltransferase [Geminicoccus sp.]HMU49192.1 UDP-N-acetylglucosamine 1-carboxyvinyltransferase [Geminicoccaceae bacterium]